MQKPELLAPAGDLEKARFAFAYGADAIYAGLPMFSLRTRENRFDIDAVRDAINFAHQSGKKLYLTANIYAHNEKIEPFLEAMERVVPLGADAYIMSDPGLIDLVRERFPGLPLHLSTQANNTNWAQLRFWKKQGISRVILARELSLSEITEIVHRNPDVEAEAFVHGALCMAYSGRCLLSDYMTGRPSNSGACTQSCRWEYRVEESKRPDEYFPVTQDQHGSYIFYSKDLCAIELLPRIIEAGVKSLKIEGRNKNFLYLATVTRVYRDAIDACFDGTFEKKLPVWLGELATLNQRGYTRGFFEGRLQDMMNYEKAAQATRLFTGRVLRSAGDNLYEIDVKGKITVGEELEWVTPRGIFKERVLEILNPLGESLSCISAGAPDWNPRIRSKLELNDLCLARVALPPGKFTD